VGRDILPSSILFILCTYTYHVYIYSYICNKKLSPKFLWVSKFNVKLGVIVKKLKFIAGR